LRLHDVKKLHMQLLLCCHQFSSLWALHPCIESSTTPTEYWFKSEPSARGDFCSSSQFWSFESLGFVSFFIVFFIKNTLEIWNLPKFSNFSLSSKWKNLPPKIIWSVHTHEMANASSMVDQHEMVGMLVENKVSVYYFVVISIHF